MRTIEETSKFIHREYDSLDEWLRYLDTNTHTGREYESQKESNYYSEWSGTDTYSQARDDYALNGLSEYNRAVDAALDTAIAGEVRGGKHYWSEAPGKVSINRYLSNQARPCQRVRRANKPGPHISVVVDIGALAIVAPERMRDGAACIMAALETFRSRGTSFDLTITSHAELSGKSGRVSVKVLDSRRLYSPYLAAFLVGHPSVLRRLVFRWREHDDQAAIFGSSYGPQYGGTVDIDGTIATRKITSTEQAITEIQEKFHR